MAFFSREGCGPCEDTSKVLDEVGQSFPQMRVETFIWTKPGVSELLKATLRRLRVPDEKTPGPPVVIVGRDVIGPADVSRERIEAAVRKYTPTGAPRTWDAVEEAKRVLRLRTRWRYRSLAMSVFDAGIRDGCSPWAFAGVLALMVGLRLLERKRADAAMAASAFVGAAFVLYFAIGLFARPTVGVVVLENEATTLAHVWRWTPVV
ncbi:MAG: hypothetical protein ACE5O2_08580, partial [Armatimonadota bacterium]